MLENRSKRAVMLLSGGLDSTTAAAVAISEGKELVGLSFDYGQRHNVELDAAKRIAISLGITEHHIVPLEFWKTFGGSSLVDNSIPILKNRTNAEMVAEIPTTYVPGRGFIFLSVAVALAESLDIKTIVTGYVDVDAAGYPDSSKSFVSAFRDLLDIGAVRSDRSIPWSIYTPLIDMQKSDVIKAGISLGVDYSQTVTCYEAEMIGGKILACGCCDACLLRKEAFVLAGVVDPTLYR